MCLERIYFSFWQAWGALFVCSCDYGVKFNLYHDRGSLDVYHLPPAHVSALVSSFLDRMEPALADLVSLGVSVPPRFGFQKILFSVTKLSCCCILWNMMNGGDGFLRRHSLVTFYCLF